MVKLKIVNRDRLKNLGLVIDKIDGEDIWIVLSEKYKEIDGLPNNFYKYKDLYLSCFLVIASIIINKNYYRESSTKKGEEFQEELLLNLVDILISYYEGNFGRSCFQSAFPHTPINEAEKNSVFNYIYTLANLRINNVYRKYIRESKHKYKYKHCEVEDCRNINKSKKNNCKFDNCKYDECIHSKCSKDSCHIHYYFTINDIKIIHENELIRSDDDNETSFINNIHDERILDTEDEKDILLDIKRYKSIEDFISDEKPINKSLIDQVIKGIKSNAPNVIRQIKSIFFPDDFLTPEENKLWDLSPEYPDFEKVELIYNAMENTRMINEKGREYLIHTFLTITLGILADKGLLSTSSSGKVSLHTQELYFASYIAGITYKYFNKTYRSEINEKLTNIKKGNKDEILNKQNLLFNILVNKIQKEIDKSSHLLSPIAKPLYKLSTISCDYTLESFSSLHSITTFDNFSLLLEHFVFVVRNIDNVKREFKHINLPESLLYMIIMNVIKHLKSGYIKTNNWTTRYPKGRINHFLYYKLRYDYISYKNSSLNRKEFGQLIIEKIDKLFSIEEVVLCKKE